MLRGAFYMIIKATLYTLLLETVTHNALGPGLAITHFIEQRGVIHQNKDREIGRWGDREKFQI
jgi:hypothetical protein